jgi:hypothetical protein
MKKLIFILTVVLMVVSCNKEPKISAQYIIDRAIEVSGGDRFANSTIDFDFRNRHYKASRHNGVFQLEREFKDSLNIIRDIYNNTEYKRLVDDVPVHVADTMAVKYTNSVNSVHYFMVLPYGLNDTAVVKTYIGTVSIREKRYHKIKITFEEHGGGKDYEDVFVYWFDTENYKLDYLAYLTYNSDRTIDLRFREAHNERFVNGIRFVDYNNYKPESMEVDLLTLDTMFEDNDLILLSKIENENIVVE